MNPAMLPDHRHLRYGILTLVAAWALLCGTPTPHAISHELPDRLDDAAFWSLVTDFSEPGGYFRSDNLTSNELGYQKVIPDLVGRTQTGRVYLGVGPEQNFTYIAALKPALSIIFDVRRGNLLVHLMYKALFELAGDRAEFVSMLFSKPRPAGVTTAATAADLFAAFASSPGDAELYGRNLAAIEHQLTDTHALPLSRQDVNGLERVYRAFYSRGFAVRFSPTYADLMIQTDSAGVARSYLATESAFELVKMLESRNLVVPVVGDFAGPKAIRSIGTYLKAHGATVSAFYLSNVEQYLDRAGKWPTFCHNVATLPLDGASTFIRTSSGP